MILTAADIATLNSLSTLLQGSGHGPLNSRIADRLAKIFGGGPATGSCFPCQCAPYSIQDALRDEPIRTFIRLLVCVGAAGEGVVDDDAGGVGGVDCPDPEIDMLTAFDYGVLAETTITNTGTTHIYGDLGLSAGSAVTGAPTVHGETHVTDAEAAQAKIDLTAAYLDAAGRTGGDPIVADLGGQTLAPGIYNSATSIGLTGTLVLDGGGDANAFWIFQAGTTVITAVSSQVVLINGANARNVFWQVGSSATLGATSVFKGTILALTAISAGTGANIEGRLLARNAAVNLLGNNVTVPSNIC